MKLGAKIFCCVTIFFSAAFLFGGYVLISYFYEVAMEREVEAAVEQYQYNKFVVEANLITRGEEWFEGALGGKFDMESMASDMNGTVAFFSLGKDELLSKFPKGTDAARLLSDISEDQVKYRFLKIGERMYVLVAGLVPQGAAGIYLVTGVDVQQVLEQQERIVEKFGVVYAAAIAVGMVLILGFSAVLTKPIKRLIAVTKKIADGNYRERIAATGSDEVGQLAADFNRMAAAVEEKVQKLSENARQKEDFVANFAHELKTPLTSIIGYADRIYKRELPRAEQRQAAYYIWNEGMRLEALSLKLMDLTVLSHGEFSLQQMEAEGLLRELSADVAFFMEEKQISFSCEAKQASVAVEYDLFKTLFLNLVDNAAKAGAAHIRVTGRVESTAGETSAGRAAALESSRVIPGDSRVIPDSSRMFAAPKEEAARRYVIAVEDDGSGIPAGELNRITEAFYMVDKSRSRKLHGAGIGLALCEQIARIHGSELEFESDGKSGTRVRVRLCIEEEDMEDGI